MIAILNYGSGNVQAISNVYQRVGIQHIIASKASDLAAAERLILPGVGAFDQAMQELTSSGLRDALEEAVIRKGKPVLGICVGMQMLAKASEEGRERGLGWIDALVRRFESSSSSGRPLQLPHMGWNAVDVPRADALLDGVDGGTGFYFLHSYYFDCSNEDDVLATTTYGRPFVSAVRRGNICGVQFHPEKSHHNGVKLLSSFARL